MPVARSKKPVATSSSSKKHTAAEIYDDLLEEATSGTDFYSHDERPLKRRKVPTRSKQNNEQVSPSKGKERQQSDRSAVTLHDLGDDQSDDDLDFEDVDLDHASLDSDENLEDVKISLGQHNITDRSASGSRRRPMSRTDKHLRVLGHKAHVVALLGHCMIVNSRCNDPEVQKLLKSRLTATTRKYLRPDRNHTQFQQDRTFTMGLEQAFEEFHDAFRVTAPGLQRPHWQDDEHESTSDDVEVLDRKAFIRAATQMSGSQDTGNQLFCAMLRAAGVQARLVCSLQVLPLANTAAVPRTPSKHSMPAVFAIAPDTPLDRPDVNSTIKERAIASARSRIGQPRFQKEQITTPPKAKSKSFHKLAYPVFWTEALNVAYQKWQPIDPIVTQTINKPSKMEPPVAYPLAQLVYAIAFFKNGSAKDVTRRYAKAYNAKTRRMRLDSMGEHERSWLQKVMRMFAKQGQSDTDLIEETEMSQRVGREGLPSNIQDFRGHPVYALERHLKRHEVIHPRREAGKVNAGTAANPKMEIIFRREDVHVCRSADQWFRHGRVLKAGQQPLKLVPARTRRKESDDESDQEQPDTNALYILSQTELYIPKSVVRGKVPRNAFGNLDIYVPSMVPPGGAHIRHPLTKSAAEVLKIDAVDAVTGFKFSGRKGTAVIEGAVIPEHYTDAVHAVIEGLLWQEADKRSRSRSALAMRMWKHMLQGLRIAERVASYATEKAEPVTVAMDMTNSTAWYAEEEEPLHSAGRYTLEELMFMAKASKKKATKSRRADSKSEDEYTDSDLDGYKSDAGSTEHIVQGEDGLGGGLLPDSPVASMIPQMQGEDEMGGGFLPCSPDVSTLDQTDHDGGFMPDDGQDEVMQDSTAIDLTQGLSSHEESRLTRERSGSHQPYTGTRSNMNQYSTSDSDVPLPSRLHPKARPLLAAQGTDEQDPTAAIASDDKESLISHDPEDDDAEPDWMESD